MRGVKVYTAGRYELSREDYFNYDPNDVDGRPSDEDLSEDLGDDGWPDDDDGVAGARPQA